MFVETLQNQANGFMEKDHSNYHQLLFFDWKSKVN